MDVPKLPWSRILAVALGAVGVVLYVWADPFGFLPGPVAAGLGSVPVTLLLYGLSGQPWRSCLGVGLGVGLGSALGQYLG